MEKAKGANGKMGMVTFHNKRAELNGLLAMVCTCRLFYKSMTQCAKSKAAISSIPIRHRRPRYISSIGHSLPVLHRHSILSTSVFSSPATVSPSLCRLLKLYLRSGLLPWRAFPSSKSFHHLCLPPNYQHLPTIAGISLVSSFISSTIFHFSTNPYPSFPT